MVFSVSKLEYFAPVTAVRIVTPVPTNFKTSAVPAPPSIAFVATPVTVTVSTPEPPV